MTVRVIMTTLVTEVLIDRPHIAGQSTSEEEYDYLEHDGGALDEQVEGPRL